MIAPIRSWAVDQPISSPLAIPTGLRGWLAGRFMLWTNAQNSVVDLLDVRAGDRVLEIGYGPGALLRLLDRHTVELRRVAAPAATVVLAWHGGTDPSRAGRRLRLPGSKLDQLHDSLAHHFGHIERRRTACVVLGRLR